MLHEPGLTSGFWLELGLHGEVRRVLESEQLHVRLRLTHEHFSKVKCLETESNELAAQVTAKLQEGTLRYGMKTH